MFGLGLGAQSFLLCIRFVFLFPLSFLQRGCLAVGVQSTHVGIQVWVNMEERVNGPTITGLGMAFECDWKARSVQIVVNLAWGRNFGGDIQKSYSGAGGLSLISTSQSQPMVGPKDLGSRDPVHVLRNSAPTTIFLSTQRPTDCPRLPTYRRNICYCANLHVEHF